MLSLNQVIYDMRIRFPLLQFQITLSDNGPKFYWVYIRSSNQVYMKVELNINEDEESVIACIIENHGFMRKDFTIIMDSLLNSFD